MTTNRLFTLANHTPKNNEEALDTLAALQTLIDIADTAEAMEAGGTFAGDYTAYVLRRSDTYAIFYIGISTDPDQRLYWHMAEARGRASQPVSKYIRGLLDEGLTVKLQETESGMTLLRARQVEVNLITAVQRDGGTLVNKDLTGLVVNRYSRDTPEYTKANREYKREHRKDPAYLECGRERSREYRATSEGRMKNLASTALSDLKKGGSLTPCRMAHLTEAGPEYWEKAATILEARGGNWPE